MAKRFATAILMCAVMVLVAAVPLALADIHTVVKGPQGPNASAMTWEFVPPGLGTWTAKLTNNGLRSLVVDVEDITAAPESVLHQRIRFAAYDALPTGPDVITMPVVMSPTHVYAITVTPNGPRGSSCVIEDMFDLAIAPTPAFTATVSHMDVTVDASASTDDGMIMSYDWTFGDGGIASDKTATHTYEMPGTYTITLKVIDDEGLEASLSKDVEIIDMPPVAMFTFTVNGATVNVDAIGSSDDYGISSWDWDWGDGTTGTGMTASHTYGLVVSPLMASMDGRPPGFPYATFGYVYMPDGVTPAVGASVSVLNSRTGYTFTTVTDMYGYYTLDANDPIGGGCNDLDVLTVTATLGTMTGTGTSTVDWALTFSYVNIVLTGGEPTPHDYLVTLTVTDMLGQKSTMTQLVTVYYY